MAKFFVINSSLYYLNSKITYYTFLKFLLHVLAIKQAIENVSGY